MKKILSLIALSTLLFACKKEEEIKPSFDSLVIEKQMEQPVGVFLKSKTVNSEGTIYDHESQDPIIIKYVFSIDSLKIFEWVKRIQDGMNPEFVLDKSYLTNEYSINAIKETDKVIFDIHKSYTYEMRVSEDPAYIYVLRAKYDDGRWWDFYLKVKE